MTKINHTPGPWTPIKTVLSQGATAHHYFGTFFTEFHDSEGNTIGYALNEGDAHLIAAAPDLLKAVKTALRELNKWRETFPEDEDLPGIIDELYEALNKVRP